MDLKVLNMIRNQYYEIYQEMQALGIFRFKKHLIKIAQTLKEFYNYEDNLDNASLISSNSNQNSCSDSNSENDKNENNFEEFYDSDQYKDISFDSNIDCLKVT